MMHQQALNPCCTAYYRRFLLPGFKHHCNFLFSKKWMIDFFSFMHIRLNFSQVQVSNRTHYYRWPPAGEKRFYRQGNR